MIGTALRGAALAVLALWTSYQSYVAAAVNIAHRRAPEQALSLVPDDPVALNSKGSLIVASAGQATVGNDEIAGLARRSLREQALNPHALRLLGLSANSEGSFAPGRPAMLLANRMTRRDLLAQLWLIEEAVSRDDVAGALVHYDEALRTSEESQQLLFPVLTGALEDKALWDAFIPYIREPVPWLGDFARHAIRNGTHPALLSELVRRAGGLPPGYAFASLEGELLKRLVDAGEFGEAANYYRSIRGTDPRVLGAPAFTPAATDPRFAPITWELFSGSGISSSFLRAESGRAIELHVSVESAVSGAVARKLVIVPPGRYRFHAVQRLEEGGDNAQAGWELRCGSGATGRILWSGAAPLLERPDPIDAGMTIPAECGAVTMRLLISAGTSTSGIDAIFSGVSLRPIKPTMRP